MIISLFYKNSKYLCYNDISSNSLNFASKFLLCFSFKLFNHLKLRAIIENFPYSLHLTLDLKIRQCFTVITT